MTEQEKKSFGAYIREQRELHEPKMSLRELARKCDISAAYLSNIERGRCDPPSAGIVQSIALHLGIDPYTLLKLAQRVPPALMQSLVEMPEEAIKALKIFESLMVIMAGKEEASTFRNILALLVMDNGILYQNETTAQIDVMKKIAQNMVVLERCKQNPSGEDAKQLEQGLVLLRALAPQIFEPLEEDPIYKDLLAYTKEQSSNQEKPEEGTPK